MMTPDGKAVAESCPATSFPVENFACGQLPLEVKLQKYLLIAIGGALGSVTRYLVGSTIVNRMGTRFPYGTFVINLTACLIIGFFLSAVGQRTEVNPSVAISYPDRLCGRL